MRRSERLAEGPPALLQKLYGSDQVLSLRDFLLRLCESSPDAKQVLNKRLLQPYDHRDYSKLVLSDVLCIVDRSAQLPSSKFTLAQFSSQVELLHRAIEALLHSPNGRKNVLCYGYRRKRPSAGGRQLLGSSSTEIYHHNAISDSLLTSPWELLLSRIGDTLMLYLLLHVTMFRRLPNGCCLQLSGPPAHEKVRNFRRYRSIPSVLENIAIDQPRKLENLPSEPALKRRKVVSSGFPLTYKTQELSNQNQTHDDGHEIGRTRVGQGEPHRINLKTRPSSWQRRKLYQSKLTANDSTKDENVIPPTQPDVFDSHCANDERHAVCQNAASPKVNAARPQPWPRYLPKFADMYIPRSPVFYSAGYPSKPGFPKKHLLNVIAGKPKCDRILYSAIFEPRNNPIGRLGNMFKAMQYSIPSPAKRVPKKHRHLLKHLSSLVRRAAKCPFAILLNRYCPLPQHLGRTTRSSGQQEWETRQGDGSTKAKHNEALEGLMDELFELESGQQVRTVRSVESLDARQSQPTGLVQKSFITPQSSSQCQASSRDYRKGSRRQRRTGLSLLVAEAQSQLPQDSETSRGDLLTSTIQGTENDVMGKFHALESLLDTNLGSIPLTQRASEDASQMHPNDGMPIHTNKHLPENLATCFVPHTRVTAFVWAVVKRIVPAAMLGDRQCQRRIRCTIDRFVSLRRYEQMSIHQTMQGLKLSRFKWLGMVGKRDHKKRGIPPSQAADRQRMLALWLGWLFALIVVPLLRAQFFCTESEAYRQQVFYYRKPVWMQLAASALDGLSGTQFARISACQAQKILQSRKIGVARLRLLPKRSGMRYIINLSRKSKVTFKSRKKSILTGRPMPPTVLSFPTVNSLLKNVHRVLKLEAIRQPTALGSSLFGYNDVYCRLQPFIKDSRCNGAQSDSPQKPYIVSVDVSRAFDHVDVSILIDIVTPLLQSEQYMILKYSEIVSLVGGDIKVIPRRVAVPMDAARQGSIPFPEQAAQWALSSKCKVWVDGVVYEKISREEVLLLLKQHLTANLIRLRKAWHYQCRGIAQGSTLSTLLCCLYLAHVERICFKPLIAAGPAALELGPALLPAFASVFTLCSKESAQPSDNGALTLLARQAGCTSSAARNASTRGAPRPLDSFRSKSSKSPGRKSQSFCGRGPSPMNIRMENHTVLLRLIDDWLLVTYHKEVAEAVARCMVGGIPAYNVAVNPAKTKLSFPLELANGKCIPPSIYVAGNGSCFVKWCGLLLNARTLEFQGDYTRYAGEHMSTSFNVPYQRKPGSVLGLKLCHYLRPKLHPLLLDRNINSWSTIRINIFQAFAVAAMKFHCYVKALSSPPAEGTKVLWEALEAGISFVCKTTRSRRVAPAHHQDVTVKCEPRVSSAHVRYLGIAAFRRILGRKQSMHAAFIRQLDEALASPQCVRCAKNLAQVIDTSESTVLNAIEY